MKQKTKLYSKKNVKMLNELGKGRIIRVLIKEVK